jgi:hypothetical protein
MELSAVARTQAEQTTDCTPVFRIGTVEVDLQVQPYIQAGDLDLAPRCAGMRDVTGETSILQTTGFCQMTTPIRADCFPSSRSMGFTSKS